MAAISDIDARLFTAILVILYASAAFNVVALHFVAAPYGKHRPRQPVRTLPTALAWFLMESPTLWLTLLVYPLGPHRAQPLALLSISLYTLHYFHRTVIYPLRLRKAQAQAQAQDPGLPLTVAISAFVFNLLNAYLQSRSASRYADRPNWPNWGWARVVLGLGIFAWGMKVNIESDLALVKLKREGGGGYKIPRGGWFEWVCSPNYMGEAAEWLGLALVAWSPAAAGFFLYTCSNLVPRARAHLRWYREKFGDEYPRSRKAILPFIY